MKKKIIISFWTPQSVLDNFDGDFEFIYPKEAVTGLFTDDEVKSLLPGADAVLISTTAVDKTMIDLGVNLKAIGRLGVGCDSVDYVYAGKKGIPVINTPLTVTHSTAELTIAIMLDVARSITYMDKKLRREKQCFNVYSFETTASSLYGKTLGIVGFGRIGKAVGKKAHGLGMKIIYSDTISAPKDVEDAICATQVDLEYLLGASDFVSIHCPYTPENHHLINDGTIAMMKPAAYLINAARGKLVDEGSLVKALDNKTIKGAALDVYEFEPCIRQELLGMDNVVLAPHIGTWNYDTRIEMALESLTGLITVLKGGTPPNIFNEAYLVKQN